MSDFQQSPLNQLNAGWSGTPQAWGLGQGGPFGQQGGGYAFGHGPGQAAFGQQGGYGGAWGGNQGFGNAWQRQLSPQDVGEIVRQLVPYLPQVVAQAQQPQAAFGYSGFGQSGFSQGGGFGGFGHQGGRQLSQQDVNEVVRQILPVIPQIVSLLQGQQQPYVSAIHGGHGQNQGWGFGGNPWAQGNLGGGQGNPWAQSNPSAWGYGNQGFGGQGHGPFGQQQSPFGQAAFGNQGGFGQRQLSQQDVNEVVRQLTAALPQVIANLQAINQNQHQQRAA